MTTYTAADVNAWYQAIDNLPSSASLPAGELAVYVASLNSGHLSPTQVQSAIENSAFTRNIVDKVIREYVAAYGGVPTQAALESYVSYASKSAAHLANLPAVLANSAAFAAAYGAGVNAHTIVGDALATALYTNAFGAAPPASWLASHKGLTVAVVLNQIANSAAFISDTSVAIAAFQNAEITGTEQTSGPLDLVGKTFVLTTGVDTVNGGYKNVAADLTPYNYNGKGPTLNVGDSISNVTNLIVTDQFGEGNDVIPSGVNLSNITNVDLTTQGVAGGGNSDSGAAFDVSGVTGLKTVNVVSYGGNFGQASSSGPAIESGDWVKAAATTAISVTQNNTGNVGVWTLGGSTVAVVDNGTPEYPAGVNDFNAGVNVGSLYTPGANPTGAVTVTEYGNNAVFVFGGSAAAGSNAVTVDTAGYGQVLVGDWEISTQSPSTNVTSGNISVTDTDTRNAPAGPIGVFGGQDVTVASTPQLGGDVIVGTLASGGGNTSLSFNAATNQQFVATGDVSVTNEAAIGDELNYQSGQTSGVAGATVVVGGANITVTTDTGAVAVGAPILVSTGGGGFTGAGLHSGGIAGQLDLANLGDYLEELFNGTTPVTGPGGAALVTGAVNITDTANDVSGGQFNGVYVFGGVGTSTTPAVTINNAGTQVVVGADAGRSSDFTLTGNEVVAPTGAVVVNDGTSTLAPNQAYDNIANTTHHHIDIVGATITNVTVTTNAGGVTVGDADVTPDINVAEPTGNVSVTDSAGAINPNSTTNAGAGDSGGDEVNVYGASGTGSFVKVVATDGDVNVGTDDALPFTNPNGAVNVMVAAIETGSVVGNTINVYGGNGITISTTGAEEITAGSAAAPVAGAVSITDSFNGANLENTNADAITVSGGGAVTIKESASSGDVNVGDDLVQMNAAGTGLANAADYASGPVSITNASGTGAQTVFGTGNVTANVFGSASVTVIGATAVNITDEATTLATAGSGAGSPIGPSTLNTVALDGVSGGATITTNAATLSLSVFDNATAGQTTEIEEGSAYALTLTVGNESKALTIDDVNNQATSITVNDSATLAGNAAGSTATVTLEASSATSVTFTNSGAQTFDVTGLAALKTITASGAGALTIVDINPGATSFNGAADSSAQTVGLEQNALGAGVTLIGGAGSNTLIADYVAAQTDVALGTNARIKGFSTLALGTAAGDTNGASPAVLSGGVYQAGQSATAEKDIITVGNGTGTDTDAGGSTYSFKIGATNISYTAAAGASGAAIANGLAAAIFAAGVTGLNVTVSGGVLSLTATSTGPAGYGAVTNVTAGTLTLGDVETAGQNAVASDNGYNAAGFTALTVGATAGDVAFTNVGAGATLTITASPGGGHNVDYLLAGLGASNALPLTVGVDGAVGVGTAGITATVLSHGIQSVSVNSLGEVTDPFGNSQTNTVAIGDTAASTLTISGDQALTLALKTDANTALTELTSNVTKIDASNSSGNVDVSGVALKNHASHTILGGSGVLTADGGTNTGDIDSITTGAGGGVITIGAGGSWNSDIGVTVALTTYYGAFDVGSESVNLSAATATSSTIKVNDGATANQEGGIGAGGITGFKAVASAAADKLSFANTDAKDVLANTTAITVVGNLTHAGLVADVLDPSGKLASDIVNLTYTAANGVISFGATGGHTLSSFTVSELIAAAEIITAAANGGAGDTVASFVADGNTFVVSSGQTNSLYTETLSTVAGTNVNSESIIELIGQATDTGFGSSQNLAGAISTGVGASGAVLANVYQNDAFNDGVTGTSKVYNDTGYSLDSLTVANTAAITTTFNNLAPASELTVNAGGHEVGNVVVTQTGTGAGANSLVVDFQAADTVDSLKVSNDWALSFIADGSADVKSLVDTSGAVTSLSIQGAAGGFAVDAVTATALTSINAGKYTGDLTLGDATALSQTGLTIVGALGGDLIFANGTHTTITIGDATGLHPVTGAVDISAAGGGDTISVTDQTASGSLILAGGAGDTISVDTGVNNIGTGTIAHGVTGALGSGDTVKLADGGADTVWLGANSLVNLVKNPVSGDAYGADTSTANVTVTHDLTGVTSSGVVAGSATAHGTGLETISGAANIGANGNLTITFENTNGSGATLHSEAWAGGAISNALVNVSSATSLGNALDIAAAQSVIYDAQHGHNNTTVVGGTAELNGNAGLLDWFQYGGNTYIVEDINTSSNTGSGGAHSHTALTATDAVVELVGLVNLGTSAQLHFGLA